MAREHEAEQLLRIGLTPSEVAGRMGVSVTTVIQYLRTRVGEGSLRFSDIYFAIPKDKRQILQRELEADTDYVDTCWLAENGLSREEFDLFLSLRERQVFAGDMYEYICEIELTIHQLVRTYLLAVPHSGGFGPRIIGKELRSRVVA